MIKKIEVPLLIFCLVLTVVIFSFSTKNAQTSSAQSDKIVNVFVETVDEVAHKIMGEFIEKNDIDIRDIVVKVTRKTAHFLEYAFQGAVLFMAFAVALGGKKYFRTAIVGLATAVADEFLQTFSLGRIGRISDIIIDFSGTVAGILIGVVILKIIGRFIKTKTIIS